MKIFIDSGEVAEIEKYLAWGLCDGVTTNPTIMLKAGVTSQADAKKRQVSIAKLIAPRPLSVEVTSDQPTVMLRQARQFARWAKNIMVKITVTDRAGTSLLPVIYQLASEGIAVNVTAICTQNQALLAAKALENGRRRAKKVAPFPHIISIFGGRISEEHGVDTTTKILTNVRTWLDQFQYPIEIIVGSVRSPENIDSWATTGAHILTIPAEVLAKALSSGRTRETVAQFLHDASAAVKQMR